MIEPIDLPDSNDNRKYNYGTQGLYFRKEFPVIADWITPGSKVIDLGCGNGSLMKYICDRKKVQIEGIELSSTGVEACNRFGFKAFVGSIDNSKTYQRYADREFDFAICNVTLPMVMYPEVLVAQMQKIARYLIISFPNFGYLGNRLDMLIHGRVPHPMLYGYTWFNTGLIHQLSIQDFENFSRSHGLRILRSEHLGAWRHIAKIWAPNIFSKEGIYLCDSVEKAA